MNFVASQSPFLTKNDCPKRKIEEIFGQVIPFMVSVYKPWENEGQECPRTTITADNQKAKELFHQQANILAIDITGVIRNLELLPDGTKLRMISKSIDAILQIKGKGQKKKIGLMFTNSGSWRVSCFAEIEIRLLSGSIYPHWLNNEQKALYKKLRWLYSHHKPTDNF